MYVMVLHQITNPDVIWTKAQQLLADLPADLTLHHTFSTPDGKQAVCIWEAAGIEPVKALLAPAFAGGSIDTYFVANNKEGVAVPPLFAQVPQHV